MQIWHGSHHLGTHGWLRLLVAAALVLVLILTLEASPAAGASAKACRVTNASTGQTHQRLQQAVKAAKLGDKLIVTGTCYGGTFINKSVVIVGKKTKRTGKPVLDGDLRARVLTIKPRVKVSIRSLTVRDGRASRILEGGGISNKGKTTLRDVVVRDNPAARGGGIYNAGVLRMLGRTIVKGSPMRPTICVSVPRSSSARWPACGLPRDWAGRAPGCPCRTGTPGPGCPGRSRACRSRLWPWPALPCRTPRSREAGGRACWRRVARPPGHGGSLGLSGHRADAPSARRPTRPPRGPLGRLSSDLDFRAMAPVIKPIHLLR